MRRPPASYRLAANLFARGLGVVYVAAFASLAVQIAGLAGRNGILPAQAFLDAVQAQTGTSRFWDLPTLFWWTGASDGMLVAASWAGAAAGALVACGLAPRLGLCACWLLYLSLATVTRVFLNFQWDALLLEAGFLALLLAPTGLWRPITRAPDPPRWALILVRWLLFRLMFSSGVVKLASGDATWWELRALDIHYFTQPLPTWTAWWAHQLPHAAQAVSVAIMFVIELGLPFLIFAPRPLRLVGCAGLVSLQVLIAATGNYAFFNLLTLVLCLSLVDDATWPAWLRRRLPAQTPDPDPDPDPPPAADPAPPAVAWSGQARRIAALAVTTILVTVSTAAMTMRWRWEIPWPAPVEWLLEAAQPLRIVNAYGLFAVMTTVRHEIVVEGSDDGTNWRAYEFKWKPGNVNRRPLFVAPHQPRLDWQMWFAALSDYSRQPWFRNLLVRLLQGSPEVLALLEHNPFPDRPPRTVRAVVYDYHFTDVATRGATGAWWRREMLGLYATPATLPR